MKALTVKQPFATLILAGRKTCEYRTWPTNHRGRLAIHSGASSELIAAAQRHYSYFYTLRLDPVRDFPAGRIMGTVNVVDCLPPGWWIPDKMDRISKDYVNPRTHWAWILEDPEWLSTTIACRGALSLWDAPIDV